MRLVNAILGVAALGLVAWIVATTDPAFVLDAAAEIGLWFPVALATHFASLVAASVSLMIAVGAPLGFGGALAVEMAGHAINEATPLAKLGELTKYGMLADRLEAERAAAGLIVWNIGLFISAAVTVALACLVALAAFDVAANARPVVIGAAIANGAAAAIAMAVLWLRIGQWPFAVLRAVRVSEERVERWRDGWLRVEEAWRLIASDRRRLVGIAVASFAVRAINVAEGAVIIGALGVEPLWPVALVGYAAFQLAYWITSWVPLQTGTAEGGSFVAFAAMGLPPMAGVVLELTRKLRRLLFIAAGLVILGLGLARPRS